VLLAVGAGSLLPVQFALNGRLAEATGSVILASAISYLVGSSVLVSLLATGRFGRPSPAELRRAPWWSFLGGVVGAWYIASSVYFISILGATLTMGLVLGGQTLTGLVIDHFGAFGVQQRPLDRKRLFAAAVVVAALVLLVA
jgi:transporter family-2 protein